MAKIVRLTRGQLRKLIKEEVSRAGRRVRENADDISLVVPGNLAVSMYAHGDQQQWEQDFGVSIEVGQGGAAEVRGPYDDVVACLEALGMSPDDIEAAVQDSML